MSEQHHPGQAPHEAPMAEQPGGPLRGLTPNVIRMGWVSFFADISSEMLYPVTPIFLAMVLGAPPAAIGLIEGVAEGAASLMKTVAGRLSDLSGKRLPYILGGYTLSAVAKPMIALAQVGSALLGWPVVWLARVLDRFGKGLRTSPRDALIADSVQATYRGRAFGWHRAMDSAGAVLGPLLALLMLCYLGGNLQRIFLLAFIPGIVGALLVLTVREKRGSGTPKHIPSLRFGALPGAFRAYLVAWGLFALANSSDVFLILRAQQFFQAEHAHLTAATITVILLYTLYNLVYAASSPWLGALSDRLGRKAVLIGGLLVFALVYAGFAFACRAWHIWALFAVYGLYAAATDGVGKALAVDLVPKEIRAGAVGLLGTVTGVLTLAASLVAGLLWQAAGHMWPIFAYGAAGALFGALLLSRVPVKAKALDAAP